jgi:hypothetical protein
MHEAKCIRIDALDLVAVQLEDLEGGEAGELILADVAEAVV